MPSSWLLPRLSFFNIQMELEQAVCRIRKSEDGWWARTGPSTALFLVALRVPEQNTTYAVSQDRKQICKGLSGL